MSKALYTVRILNAAGQVYREWTMLDKETAERIAETAFNAGHASQVMDPTGRVISEFEV